LGIFDSRRTHLHPPGELYQILVQKAALLHSMKDRFKP
jgi:hypothetical protein